MVNTAKEIISLRLLGRFRESTKCLTWQHYQADERKSSFIAERVRALGVLHSLWSQIKLAAEKRQEMNFLSNEDNEQWIVDIVERETAVESNQVEDAEPAMNQEQEDIRNA